MRTIGAGEFKAKCLALMDEVQATGRPVLITKRGKPVARLTAEPAEPAQTVSVESISRRLRGMATVVGDLDDWLEPVIPEEDWDHLRANWPSGPAE